MTTKCIKNHKQFYEFVVEDLNYHHTIDASEIMFFDDVRDNIQSAKDLGISGYCYDNFDDFFTIINPLLR